MSNYLLFNPLLYGNDRSAKYPGSNTAVLADFMSRPPFNMPATQITELSDTGKKAFATNKEIIEKTIEDFVASAPPKIELLSFSPDTPSKLRRQHISSPWKETATTPKR